MALVTGTLVDFGLDPLEDIPKLFFRATGPGVSGIALLSTKPVEVIPAANGYFEVDLVPTVEISPPVSYTIQIQRYELPSRRPRLESLPWKLEVPTAGGFLADLLRVPSNPALTWSGEEPPANPSPGSWWYEPSSGQLSEWDGGGWTNKANLKGRPGLDATGAAEDDAAVAAFVSVTGTATNDALIDTLAPVGLGRSVADFGVSKTAPAADNVTAFRAAHDWAATNAFGARTLYVPPVAPGESYNINAPITLTAPGLTIRGAGPLSRIKQTVKTEAVFRATGPAPRFEDLYLIGADDRTLVDGGGLPENMVRDQHVFGNHSGIVFQAGSDGGTARNIGGENINALVAAWAWKDTTAAYAGTNIQRLTIQNITAKNVWAAVFIREVDNLTVENVSGSYSRIPGIFADPHLIYVTSSNYTGAVRPLYGVRIAGVRVFDGVGGEPVKVSNIIGGSLSGLTVRNCPGALVLTELAGFTVEPYLAEEIYKDPDASTSASPYGGQPGMLTIGKCKDVTVMPFRHRNKTGTQSRAVSMSSVDPVDGVGNENVTIHRPVIETNHATNNTADNRSEFYVNGINCGVIQPTITMKGGYRHAFRLGGASPYIVDPSATGCAQAIITDTATAAKIIDYNPAKITRADPTGPTIRHNASTDGVTEVLTNGPRATVWDRGLIGSPSGRLIALSSGHKPTLYGAAFSLTNGRWACLSASATLPRYAAFDVGSADVALETEVRLGIIDAGGTGTYSVGHALRVVAEDVNLLVELRNDRLTVTYRSAGGLTLTNVATYTAPFVTGRPYQLKSVAFGNSVQVFVDGARVIDATLTADQVTALAAGTKHGLVERQSLASSWTAATFRASVFA